MPPPFSAKKIDGKPAYKLAREGKPVELKPARVRIDAFEICAMEGAEASFTIEHQRRRVRALGGARTGAGSGLRRAPEPVAAHAGRSFYAGRRAHAGGAGGAGRGCRQRWRPCASTRAVCCRRCPQ